MNEFQCGDRRANPALAPRVFEPPWFSPWRPMPCRFWCFPYLPKVLCRPLMTCSILRLQPCCFAYSAGKWNFCPAFLAELVPGVDLVPFWTLAVLNVYRKWKQINITAGVIACPSEERNAITVKTRTRIAGCSLTLYIWRMRDILH